MLLWQKKWCEPLYFRNLLHIFYARILIDRTMDRCAVYITFFSSIRLIHFRWSKLGSLFSIVLSWKICNFSSSPSGTTNGVLEPATEATKGKNNESLVSFVRSSVCRWTPLHLTQRINSFNHATRYGRTTNASAKFRPQCPQSIDIR